MAAIFLVLKVCKKYSVTVTLLMTGIGMLLAIHAHSVIGIGICFCIVAFGINAQQSSLTTVLGNAVSGKVAGIATGLFTGCMFVGEALCGYVPTIVSNAVFGTTAPSDCIRVSGVACIILAVVGYFVYSKAYQKAFSTGNSDQ